MLYTNEPANKNMVIMTAYRKGETTQRNIEQQIKLLNALAAGGFEILDDKLTRQEHVEGKQTEVVELVMVLCHNVLEVGLLARLMAEGFDNKGIIKVTTQTHDVRSVVFMDGSVMVSRSHGTLHRVEEVTHGVSFTDSTGEIWAVQS